MSLAEDLLKKSAEEIAKDVGGGDPDSPTETTRRTILNYKLQQKLIKETRYLVLATWFLVIATVLFAVVNG